MSKLVTNNANFDQSIPPSYEAFVSSNLIHSIEKLERGNTAFMNMNLDISDPGQGLSEIRALDHVALDTKPDTYAILLVSFGLAGIALRRRKIPSSNKLN